MIKQELKNNRNSFIGFTLGLGLLLMGGFVKFLSLAETESMDVSELMAAFPKIVLAVFGMNQLDVQTLEGYYAILENYVLVLVIIYAIKLGYNAVARELADHTEAFLFTKPIKRRSILFNKLSVGFFFLILFAIFNGLFSKLAIAAYGIDGQINQLILYYSVVIFLNGLLFFALSAMCCAITKRSERGSTIAYAVFFITYLMTVIYDLVENGRVLKYFVPLRYFESTDLVVGNFKSLWILMFIVQTVIFITICFYAFIRRDLNEN